MNCVIDMIKSGKYVVVSLKPPTELKNENYVEYGKKLMFYNSEFFKKSTMLKFDLEKEFGMQNHPDKDTLFYNASINITDPYIVYSNYKQMISL